MVAPQVPSTPDDAPLNSDGSDVEEVTLSYELRAEAAKKAAELVSATLGDD